MKDSSVTVYEYNRNFQLEISVIISDFVLKRSTMRKEKFQEFICAIEMIS